MQRSCSSTGRPAPSRQTNRLSLFAGLALWELDAAGNVRRRHDKVEVKKAGAYVELKKEFVTGADTAQVRFILDTVLKCDYAEGHVTYDDCSLRVAGRP
jgi:hypothetical protein